MNLQIDLMREIDQQDASQIFKNLYSENNAVELAGECANSHLPKLFIEQEKIIKARLMTLNIDTSNQSYDQIVSPEHEQKTQEVLQYIDTEFKGLVDPSQMKENANDKI